MLKAVVQEYSEKGPQNPRTMQPKQDYQQVETIENRRKKIPRAPKKNKEYANMLCKENADMMIGAITYINKCKVQGICGTKTR